MCSREKFELGITWYVKILIVFLMFFIPSRNILELWAGTYIKVVPDLLILLLLLLYIVYEKGRINIKLYDVLIALFLLIAFINTVIIQKISMYIFIFEVRSIMVYYILFFVIRNFNFSCQYLSILTRCIRYITYILFLLGIIEKVSCKTVAFPASVAKSIIYADNFARVHSMFFNPNTYGAFLVLSFFFVIYYEKNGKKLLLYEIVMVTSLLLSMSRSSILILLIGLIAYCLILKKYLLAKIKKIIVQILIVCLCSMTIYSICEVASAHFRDIIANEGNAIVYDKTQGHTTLYDRMEELRSQEIVDNSNVDGRLFFVKTGLKVFRDYPVLGTGFGTYGSAASMNWSPPIYEKYQLTYGFYSDNEYIKDLVETGIVGVIILILFCGSIIYSYRTKWFCVFYCIIIGWFGLFYNVLEVQIAAFLLWILLGMNGTKYEKDDVR